jgi:membrane protein YdbS with pleckstrin-like domain
MMTAEERIKLYSTRKAYFHVYSVTIVAIVAAQVLPRTFSTFSQYIKLLTSALIVASIAYPELMRFAYWLEIDQSGVTIEKGLLRRKKIIMPKHILTDMDVNQTPFQRMLKFGVLSIRSFSEDHRKVAIPIHDPHIIITKAQKLLKRNEENVGPPQAIA